ncbi:MAG: ZIP zinc transporter [Chromatiales bacterium 21-64-14]|nr:MAG: ZIP zinc transporter [Chromatiales bacterium 21-64-14]HQU14865.1 ZIP family metal transporter [Gammaproteobacteria bacterium]
MSMLIWILLFSLLGGVLSVTAAASFLALSDRNQGWLLPHLVSFATGALLGAAFLAILPHALDSPSAGPTRVLAATLLGLLAFFVLEKLVLWRHCHAEQCEAHAPHDGPGHSAAGVLILLGDGIHNFLDGILIAAAFMSDFQLGVVTALAVTAHEIPQELGDFAILLHSGFGPRKALIFNLLSSVTTVAGALLAYYSLQDLESWKPYVLAVAASSFIYIAVADLIPGLHRRVEARATAQQLVLIGAGIGLIYLAHRSLG